MIQPQEIRIANYIEYNGEIIKLDGSFLCCYIQNELEFPLNPIPLTEEILLKFGFEIMNPNYLEYKLKDGRILFDRKVEDLLLITGNNTYGKKIEFAHKLQNYVFENTDGEEITFKNPLIFVKK